MGEGIVATLISIVVIVGVVFLSLWGLNVLADNSERETDAACKAKFGQEWQGRFQYHGNNYCVNDKGEQKYL